VSTLLPLCYWLYVEVTRVSRGLDEEVEVEDEMCGNGGVGSAEITGITPLFQIPRNQKSPFRTGIVWLVERKPALISSLCIYEIGELKPSARNLWDDLVEQRQLAFHGLICWAQSIEGQPTQQRRGSYEP
jgi:hypothetical protein